MIIMEAFLGFGAGLWYNATRKQRMRNGEDAVMSLMSTVAFWGLLWLAAVNLLGLVLMGADKSRAKQGKWRIPEKTFFFLAILGGSAGCWAGMYLFRHKTRHWYFVVGMPLILTAQILVLFWLKTRLL